MKRNVLPHIYLLTALEAKLTEVGQLDTLRNQPGPNPSQSWTLRALVSGLKHLQDYLLLCLVFTQLLEQTALPSHAQGKITRPIFDLDNGVFALERHLHNAHLCRPSLSTH